MYLATHRIGLIPKFRDFLPWDVGWFGKVFAFPRHRSKSKNATRKVLLFVVAARPGIRTVRYTGHRWIWKAWPVARLHVIGCKTRADLGRSFYVIHRLNFTGYRGSILILL